nr:MAG TPA: hypothetical protein [Caudoviricetes sp.]
MPRSLNLVRNRWRSQEEAALQAGGRRERRSQWRRWPP